MANADLQRVLEDVIEQAGVRWSDDDQPAKALVVARALTAAASTPAGALRLHQAALTSAADPGASRRACVAFVAEHMRAILPTLATGPDRVGFARAFARAVTFCLPRDPVLRRLSGALPDAAGTNPPAPVLVGEPLPVSPAPDELEGVVEVLDGRVGTAARGGGNGWAWVSQEIDRAVDETLEPAMRGLVRAVAAGFDSVDARIAVLDTTRKSHHAVLQHLVATGPGREVDALWWSQSLYSKSAAAEYRDLDEKRLLPAMATDLIDVMGHEPDPSLTALFVETARKLILGLDDRHPWNDWLARLLAPGSADIPEAYVKLASADATGLPISAHLLGAEDPVGGPEEPVTGREVARRYFRERQLAAWIGEATK